MVMETTPVVTVLGKSNILPATPTKTGAVFLSCLDIFWQHIHCNRRVIFYKPSPRNLSSIIESLKTSLSLVLVHFYHWTGRLARGENQRLVINCNNLGVEFVEASIDLPINELEKDDFEVKDYFDSLCQRLDYSNEHLYTSPLLSVQATRFADEGLAVAVAISHVIADGQSLWNFLVSWGECARGKSLSLEPLHERERLAIPDPSPEKAFLEIEVDDDHGRVPNNERHVMVKEEETKKERTEALLKGDEVVEGTATESESGLGTENSTRDKTQKNAVGPQSLQKEGTVQALFHLSAASINKLKSEAAETTGKKFSSFVILCAHFWHRITIARQQSSTEIVGCAVLVNLRSRITPPLPAAYFGNVINFTVASSKAGTIAEESLGVIAQRIQAAIEVCNEERLRGLMNWLEMHESNLLPSVKFQGSGVNVASSPHFPAYEVDFGWGKPAAVRAVKVVGDGEIVLFGGRPGSQRGDVEICTALSSDTIKNLRQDKHFLATAPSTSS